MGRNLKVSQSEMERAWNNASPRLRTSLRKAAQNIRRFSSWQRPLAWSRRVNGMKLGQVVRPIGSVGCYVPGGRHPLVSSLLMGGKIVQLVQGEKKALEFDDFEEWIVRFSNYPLVQLIDLDAAIGSGDNRALLRQFTERLPCQVGGGIRSIRIAEQVLSLEAKRVIVGSALIRDGEVAVSVAQQFAGEIGTDRLTFAVDSKNGRVLIKGWREVTNIWPAAMGYEKLSAMLTAISSGGAKSIVRVGGYDDRPGIQQALDLGADGVLVPYINTVEEARQAVSCTKYPRTGTRSVYFPQRSMNKAGLLGYAGNYNNNGIVALQVETASCIDNMAEIAAVPGVDILFLGQNDLCMSMGLYEKYEFPHMYTSPELGAATQKLVENARKNNVILGLFLFGTARVGEFLEKGFTFISIGNDLHHVLTQAGAYVKDMEGIAKEKGKEWTRRPTALF